MVSFSFYKATVLFSPVSPQYTSRFSSTETLIRASIYIHSALQWATALGMKVSLPVCYVNLIMQLGSKEISRTPKRHSFAADMTQTVCFEIKNNINIPVTVFQYGPQIPKYTVYDAFTYF